MIEYVEGDATAPEGDGPMMIAHICNSWGGWGAGFVIAVSERWDLPEERYKEWFFHKSLEGTPFQLGEIQLVQVEDEPETYVVNMIAQDSRCNLTALRKCLVKLEELAAIAEATVHMPRIGAGIGGAAWEDVEAVINDTLSNIPVVVYDIPVSYSGKSRVLNLTPQDFVTADPANAGNPLV